ncbi:hypothetical protein JZ751_007574 [Albula glossodonta]|uniref:Uncharacterized protein n=1 Tax=Albula glossodonta TaxID=121402 RepID=A0A8T2N796_9TELE|nr:hypothetical protein JZ751_007574 [Albula glossodonta]
MNQTANQFTSSFLVQRTCRYSWQTGTVLFMPLLQKLMLHNNVPLPFNCCCPMENFHPDSQIILAQESPFPPVLPCVIPAFIWAPPCLHSDNTLILHCMWSEPWAGSDIVLEDSGSHGQEVKLFERTLAAMDKKANVCSKTQCDCRPLPPPPMAHALPRIPRNLELFYRLEAAPL